MPKIVCVSDTHETFPELPDGDILLHAGDWTRRGEIAPISRFDSWLGKVKGKFKHGIVIIAGNHDRLMQDNPSLGRSLIKNAHYLEDSMIELGGLKIYGSPWTPRFGSWAFMKNRDQIGRMWEQIPTGIDVLVVHGPPWGILDGVPHVIQGNERVDHVGCAWLRDEVLQRIKPRLMVFGHIHEGWGQTEVDGIKFVNAAILDGQMKPVNKPIVIDL